LFVPTDANGNIVNTYLIEDNSGGGTVYLPLRAMTNVFLSGVTNASNYIKWDSATRSVTIYDPASAKAAGDTEELDDDDDSDLDIDINQIIKELIEDLIKDKFPTLTSITTFFQSLKDKLGTGFDLDSIKEALLEKIESFGDSSLLNTFKAILKEKGLTLEQLMEKLQASSSSDLIDILEEYMSSYINGSSFSISQTV
jgi:lipoate-protein ligase A